MKKESKAGRLAKRSAFSIVNGTGALPLRPQKRQDFLRVAATRDKLVTPGFILQRGPESHGAIESEVIRNGVPGNGVPGNGVLRIGYTASRKVGNAVVRNRVKRKLRELARIVLQDQLAPGRDYVLIGRRAALKRPLARMAQDMIKALEKSSWGRP